MRFIDRTGQRYGMLTVIERAENYVSPKGSVGVRWKCRCDCGKELIVHSTSLLSGSYVSCGCYRKNRLRKDNIYTIKGDVVYVHADNKDLDFMIDLADLELLKTGNWHINKNGYVTRNKDRKLIHSLLMQPPKGMCVDHINHDKLDNRRSNLRVVTYSENGYNKVLPTTNTGEFFITKNIGTNYYVVEIDNKYVGGSYDLQEAIRIRNANLKNSQAFKNNYFLNPEYLRREMANMLKSTTSDEMLTLVTTLNNIKSHRYDVGDYKMCKKEADVVMKALQYDLKRMEYDERLQVIGVDHESTV